MPDELRKSGIDIIGDVPWGTHFCQFYNTSQDLLDVLVPYFQTGLENNEFCMWITAEPLDAAKARQAMKRNMPDFEKYMASDQIVIMPYDDWYVQDGVFEENRVLKGWVDRMEGALAKGFSGLRLTGNTFWLEKEDWNSFAHYEATVNDVIGKYRMLAICTYSLDKCNSTEVIDVIHTHQFALIKREGKWDMIESAIYQQAKEALKQSEKKFRIVADFTYDWEYWRTQDNKFVYMSPSCLRLTGYTSQEFIDNPDLYLSIIHPDDRNRMAEHMKSDLHHPDTEVLEFRIIRRDGEERWMGHLCQPVLDENDNIQGRRSSNRDITDRKQVEEEIKHKNAELEASNRELESFAYSVSHDLRAPLRSMEGFSNALLEDYADKLDEKGKQYLKYVQESSDLMGKLIDDLLKLSRVTRAEMNYEVVNLSELAGKIISQLEKTEPRRKVSLNIEPNVTAYGDGNLLRLVLENLLGNAWKFSSKVDSPQIEMGITDHNGRRAYFISDNGVGFDMTYADKLFKPFQRLHKETEFSGTGIGLATVYRIIHRHGGEVWAESKVGEGAIFYFTLH